MIHGPSDSGFGVLCDPSAVIVRMLRDDAGLASGHVGRNLKALLDASSVTKSQAFFNTLREAGIAVDWELTVLVADQPRTMHFAGNRVGEQYLVVAVRCEDNLPRYVKELAAADWDVGLADALAALHVACAQSSPQFSFYDEITRLNNELVDVQRELHKKTAHLNRLNEEKNRALGVVAHDLRNSISVLHMSSTYLLEFVADRLSDEERELLRTMHDTAESMRRLVHNVLDTAAIEAGRLNLEIAAFDAAKLLESLVKRMRPLARQSGVKLDFRADGGDGLLIEGDVGKLEQVFCNLIDNAIKFSPSGETVIVAVTRRDDSVHVSVTDHGAGISDEAMRHLFRPFTPGKTPSAQGKSGTGLGLSIAKRIVEGHAGSIEVESAPARGARFTVALPCPAEIRQCC